MATPYVDPYAVLGLERTATPDEIKRAYFALVRAHPPEREPETFKRVRAAYERVRDPERRVEADLLLHREDVLAAAWALGDLDRTDWREHFGKVSL